jgi:prolipoprotein diacylglyceryltransferase
MIEQLFESLINIIGIFIIWLLIMNKRTEKLKPADIVVTFIFLTIASCCIKVEIVP